MYNYVKLDHFEISRSGLSSSSSSLFPIFYHIFAQTVERRIFGSTDLEKTKVESDFVDTSHRLVILAKSAVAYKPTHTRINKPTI